MTDLPTPPDPGPDDVATLAELTPAMLMRCADVEDRLARAWTRGQIENWLQEAYGIKARHARRIFKEASDRWAREANAAGREGRKGQLRAIAFTGMRLAMGRKGMALDRDGGEHFFENPDVGGLARLLEFVARLDGDLTQPGALPGGFGEDAFTALHVHLYGTPPPKPGSVVEMPAESEAVAKLPEGESKR